MNISWMTPKSWAQQEGRVLVSDPLQKTDNGISFIERRGSGPTVVFLHGIGSNGRSFLPIFDRLPKTLNLVAWNAPGYLGSDPVEQSWPVAVDYARVLATFLDDLKLTSVHLVGQSLGTLIAASFARQFPERVDRLVLASSACGYAVAQGAELPANVQARKDELKALGPVAFAASRARNLVHEPTSNSAVVAEVEAAMAEVNLAGYSQASRVLASGDLCSDLAKTPVKPNFIVGTGDRITPIEQTRAAASAWQASYGQAPVVTEIDGAGHAVYLQKPAEFCAALLKYLANDDEQTEEV